MAQRTRDRSGDDRAGPARAADGRDRARERGAYVRQATRQQYPGYPEPVERAAWVWARYCVGCHVIDGDGGSDGPVLSHIGSKHDAPTLRDWIADPEAVKPDTDMPAFGKRLSPQQLEAISQYLAGRK